MKYDLFIEKLEKKNIYTVNIIQQNNSNLIDLLKIFNIDNFSNIVKIIVNFLKLLVYYLLKKLNISLNFRMLICYFNFNIKK